MTIKEFESSLTDQQPAETLSIPLQSLWWEAKGDWQMAHHLVDHLEDKVSAHIHAYLHRVEGDAWNAQYWYNRAGQPVFTGTVSAEWIYLVQLYCI